MKVYAQEKFKTLSVKRQAQVLLDCLHLIDEKWSDLEQKYFLLQSLNRYLDCIDWLEAPVEWKPLRNIRGKILSDLHKRQVLDMVVPLERFLELTIKDEHILPVTTLDQILGAERKTLPIYFVLDHLRSGFNVGSLFRTADCLGVSHIYLVGYTPTPVDKQVQKAAMGAEAWIPYSQHDTLSEVVEILRSQNVQVLALETSDHAHNFESLSFVEPTALVVGNERFGLSQKTLESVDKCVYLPMQGLKNSMNVANLLSVVTYEVARQMRTQI